MNQKSNETVVPNILKKKWFRALLYVFAVIGGINALIVGVYVFFALAAYVLYLIK